MIMVDIILINPGKNFFDIMYPQVGFRYLAAHLKKNNISVDVIDLAFFKYDVNEILEKIRTLQPKAVGISVLSQAYYEIRRYIKKIKEDLPDPPVIICGGIHVTLFPRDVLEQNKEIDYIVVSEGEDTLVELMNNMDNPRALAGIDNIGYRMDDDVIINNIRTAKKEINEITMPDWDILPPSVYGDVFSKSVYPFHKKRLEGASMIASRGCPYKCTFCATPHIASKFRKRHYESVAAEMEILSKKYNVKTIAFLDDAFNIDINNAKMILREILRRNIDIQLEFPLGFRHEMIDAELAELMARCNTKIVSIGIESGVEKTLEKINKRLNIDKLIKNVGILRKYEVPVLGYFILGFPWETAEDVEENINFSFKVGCHFVNYSPFMVIPGSEIFYELIEREKKSYKDMMWSHPTLGIDIYTESELSIKTVRQSVLRAVYEFHNKPDFKKENGFYFDREKMDFIFL
jgi:anaerobic magnesium-protoporphyrin IX monomethyl ester cyclase